MNKLTNGAVLFGAVLLLALLGGVNALAREDATKDVRRPAAAREPVLALDTLRARHRQAGGALRALGKFARLSPAAAALALHAAGYPARDVEAALGDRYHLEPVEARRLVQEAVSNRHPADLTAAASGSGQVDICVRPDGSLVVCAGGSTPTGLPSLPEPTATDWSGVEVQPADGAVAGSVISVRPAPGRALPPVSLRLAGQPLQHQVAAEGLRVQLPAQPLRGALSMTNLNTGLPGVVVADYRVRAPGVLDGANVTAAGHDWTNSYLMALASYYIYSDALGPPASARADFRKLMQSWGMLDVAYVEQPQQHLLAAVAWGQDLVLVVFRGSETHSTTHCMLQMIEVSWCAELPANWISDLAYRPLRQRPEWGEHFRTHGGFDTALDQLYPALLDAVTDRLTPLRRLFVTGHSLGGAMATLFAYRAAAHDGIAVQGVYTYGSPRVVNMPLAADYQSILGSRTQRWQNRSDPAPGVPPGQTIDHALPVPAVAERLTYQHIGRLNFLPPMGAPEVGRSSEPLAVPLSHQVAADHAMALSPASYLTRLHARLPPAVRARVPPPP